MTKNKKKTKKLKAKPFYFGGDNNKEIGRDKERQSERKIRQSKMAFSKNEFCPICRKRTA